MSKRTKPVKVKDLREGDLISESGAGRGGGAAFYLVRKIEKMGTVRYHDGIHRTILTLVAQDAHTPAQYRYVLKPDESSLSVAGWTTVIW